MATSVHFNSTVQIGRASHANSFKTSTDTGRRLASGYKINDVKDSPTEFSIANRMIANQRGMEQGIRNNSKSINMLNIAESALKLVSDITISMQNFITSAQNVATTAEQKDILNKSFQNNVDMLLKSLNNGEYNGDKMFAAAVSGAAVSGAAASGGTAAGLLNISGGVNFQFGVGKDKSLKVDFSSFIKTLSEKIGTSGVSGGIANTKLNVSGASGITALNAAQKILTEITDAAQNLIGEIGITQVRLANTTTTSENAISAVEQAVSNIKDADMWEEKTKNITAQMLMETATAVIMESLTTMRNMIQALMR